MRITTEEWHISVGGEETTAVFEPAKVATRCRLCFNGTRAALCTRALMERALTAVTAPWEMHWIDGADHSFHVLKSSGRSDEDVMTEVGAATGAWLGRFGIV